MNLALRDIRHNLGRFVLTCIGLGLLLGVVLAMVGIYRGLVSEALSLAIAPGADLWVVEEGSQGPFADPSRLPGTAREAIARMAGVERAGSLTYRAGEMVRDVGSIRVFVVGYEPGRIGEPHPIVAGRSISRSRHELVANVTSGLEIGERVGLGRTRFTVVGLTHNKVAFGGDPAVFITLRDSQELQFESRPASARRQAAQGIPAPNSDIVNTVLANVFPGASAAQVVADIRRWKHFGAMVQAEQEALLTHAVVEKVRKQIGLFTTLLVIVSTVIIALIVHTLTLDKLREIATLKLIGAPDRVIVGLIVQQSLAMGITGFAFGASLLVLVKDHFPRRVLMMPEDAMMLAAVVVVVCLLASILGVRLALKVDPATALGG